MKQYRKTHTLKKAHDIHLAKIKRNGGVIDSDNGKEIVYHFPKTLIYKKYTHFAVEKRTGKIITGWDYKGFDQEELNSEKKYYFHNYLKDILSDVDSIFVASDYSILTRQKLVNKGVNPFDQKNWKP